MLYHCITSSLVKFVLVNSIRISISVSDVRVRWNRRNIDWTPLPNLPIKPRRRWLLVELNSVPVDDRVESIVPVDMTDRFDCDRFNESRVRFDEGRCAISSSRKSRRHRS